jgi:hypothetical protein
MSERPNALPILTAVLALCSCHAPAPSAPLAGGAAHWAPVRAEWESAAEMCATRGDHLCASRYLEASLAAGGDERRLLPLLVAAQIHAGRLRAARESVARLETLEPGRQGLEEIALLLDSLIGPETATPPTGRGAEGGT